MTILHRTLGRIMPTPCQIQDPHRSRQAPATPGRSHDCLPAATGDFAALARARRVAVILDAENLVYSARDYDWRLDFVRLGQLLRRHFRRVEMHAVVSVAPDQVDATRRDAERVGWVGHARPIVTTPRHRCANGDVTCAFVTATLLARFKADTLLLGTGDGPLGLDIARAARTSFPSCRQIATLSLKATTSRLLNRENAPEIDANLYLGQDVLRI